MKTLTLSGTIRSPNDILDIDLYELSSGDLVKLTCSVNEITQTNYDQFDYLIIRDFADGDNPSCYLKTNTTFTYVPSLEFDTPVTYNFTLGIHQYSSSSWISEIPVFYVEADTVITGKDLTYTETDVNTTTIDGRLVQVWTTDSLGVITEHSSIALGDGIVFSFVAKKSSSSPVTTVLVFNSEITIEFSSDVLYVQSSATSVSLTTDWKLITIFITPAQIKVWENLTLKNTI